MRELLITIDGPAGAGKTTVSRLLAAGLGYTYVDTGALYRGVAWAIRQAGLPVEEPDAVAGLLPSLTLEFRPVNEDRRLFVNGVDVSVSIRTPEMSLAASRVSAQPAVRAFLLEFQRELGRRGGAVFEGRDMGTVVFPQADVKFFLFADVETRARRRHAELPATAGQDLGGVLGDLRKRDDADSSRSIAPLKPAPDAVCVDATHLSVEQVVARLMTRVREVAAAKT